MSIERIALAAAEDLRAHTVADPEAGLVTTLRIVTRRQAQRRLAVAAGMAASLVVGWGAHASLADRRTEPQPAPPGPTPTAGAGVCQRTGVTCLGQRSYRFDLSRPVQWHIPRAFGVDSGTGHSRLLVESYGLHVDGGVTVLEKVSAATQEHAPVRVTNVSDAHQFVEWLRSRPYLDATTPRPTTLAGRPAWHVRVTVAAGHASGPATCDLRYACHPITRQPDGFVTGVWGDMTADYTAVEVPGAGTVVVWSWAFGHHPRALARQRALVAGLSWPSG